MKVIQFICPHDPPSTQLRQLMVDQVNEWSRLQYLAHDPEYTTSPWSMDDWRQHLETPGLWWADYGAIYEHLGDSGRKIADQMFGFEHLQGILRYAPLVVELPDVRIQIVEVDDPVAEGYLPAPVEE